MMYMYIVYVYMYDMCMKLCTCDTASLVNKVVTMLLPCCDNLVEMLKQPGDNLVQPC